MGLGGGFVPVVVEADLADGDDLLVPGGRAQFIEPGILPAHGRVGVNTDRGEHGLVSLGHGQDSGDVRQIKRGDDDSTDPGGRCSVEDTVDILRQIIKIEMAVGIDEGDGRGIGGGRFVGRHSLLAASAMMRVMKSSGTCTVTTSPRAQTSPWASRSTATVTLRPLTSRTRPRSSSGRSIGVGLR